MQFKEIEITRFFDSASMEELARRTGFVQRSSPLTGFKFLLAFTTGLLNTPDGTLAQLSEFLSSACGTDITPQAIDSKIGREAQEFLRSCLDRALALLSSSAGSVPDFIGSFDHIYAVDSTNIELRPSLSHVFRGNGGGASKSSMRIQFAFDFVTRTMHMEVGDVSLSDTSTLERWISEKTLPMDGVCLFLHDLGYFKSTTFGKIGSNPGCFFLSKLHFGFNPRIEGGKDKHDLRAILDKCPESFEAEVKIGGVAARMVIRKLPDHVVNARIRRANSENSGQISNEYRRFLQYAIFITNLPEPYGMESLYALYRIRWQVELVFKVWKSVLAMHKIRTTKASRVYCEIYGKLILAVFVTMMSSWDTEVGLKKMPVSMHRVAKQMVVMAMNWASAIMDGKKTHLRFLGGFINRISRLCRKNSQKNKPVIEVILAMVKLPVPVQEEINEGQLA